MSMFTVVTKRVGCDRNGTSHVRVESLDEVSINYVAQPHRYGTVMVATSETANSDVMANVKS
jgi:hypothetical protein